jgi:hypothetical protein
VGIGSNVAQQSVVAFAGENRKLDIEKMMKSKAIANTIFLILSINYVQYLHTVKGFLSRKFD